MTGRKCCAPELQAGELGGRGSAILRSCASRQLSCTPAAAITCVQAPIATAFDCWLTARRRRSQMVLLVASNRQGSMPNQLRSDFSGA